MITSKVFKIKPNCVAQDEEVQIVIKAWVTSRMYNCNLQVSLSYTFSKLASILYEMCYLLCIILDWYKMQYRFFYTGGIYLQL